MSSEQPKVSDEIRVGMHDGNPKKAILDTSDGLKGQVNFENNQAATILAADCEGTRDRSDHTFGDADVRIGDVKAILFNII